MAFWPGQRTCGDDKVLAVGTKWEKGGEPGTRGYILSLPEKQNGNPGYHSKKGDIYQ